MRRARRPEPSDRAVPPAPQPIPFDATVRRWVHIRCWSRLSGRRSGRLPATGPPSAAANRPPLDRGSEARDGRLVEQHTQAGARVRAVPAAGTRRPSRAGNRLRRRRSRPDGPRRSRAPRSTPPRPGPRWDSSARRFAPAPAWEPTGVDLPVRGQRDRVRREDGGGNHRRGQPVDERRTHPCRIATLRHDIRVQGMPVTVLARDGDGAPHAGQAPEYGVDLGGFDTHSANLDLVVAPSAEVEHRTGRVSIHRTRSPVRYRRRPPGAATTAPLSEHRRRRTRRRGGHRPGTARRHPRRHSCRRRSSTTASMPRAGRPISGRSDGASGPAHVANAVASAGRTR